MNTDCRTGTTIRKPLRIDLPAGSLVIADLHLDVDAWSADQPVLAVEDFCRFLEAVEEAPALAILGDLFEYWLGPSHAQTEGGGVVLEALANFGGAVYLVPGNRDVLAGSELEKVGVRVALGGLLGSLEGGHSLLLLHGDELCSEDPKYQRLRAFLRFRPVRWVLRGLPAWVARRMAKGMRRRSKRLVSATAPLTVTQSAKAAEQVMRAAGAQDLVVGHAHAFREERLGTTRRFFVLDAFDRLAAAERGPGRRDLLRVGTDGELKFGSSGELGGTAR